MRRDRSAAVLCTLCPLLTLLGAARHLVAQEPPPTGPAQPLVEPFATPRELLALLDVGDRDWDAFQDGRPLEPREQEPLIKILYRWPWISEADLARWQQRPMSIAQVHHDPAAARGALVVLRGQVRSVTRRPLSARQAELFEFGEYFELELELAEGAGRAVVLTRTVPQAWQGHAVLDERTSAAGLFLKVGPTLEIGAPLLFTAPRIAWFPDRIDPELGVGPDQVWLAHYGMDIGLFDAVRPRNRSAIGDAERECFYALLQAVSRAGNAALAEQAHDMPLGALLQHPEQEHGSVVMLRGTVRRISRVVVDDPDIQARYRLSAYYQLDVLLPLGGQTIEVRDAADGAAGPVYHDTFPCTVCVRELPAAWQRLAGAPHVSQPVEVAGVFFKLWAYSAPYVESFDPQQRQLSPLLIAQQPTVLAVGDGRSDGRGGVLVGCGFLVLLAALWWLVARMHRAVDSDPRRRTPATLPAVILPVEDGQVEEGQVEDDPR